MISCTVANLLFALLVSTGAFTVSTAQSSPYIVNGTVVSDTYFYGKSPLVYPGPIASGTGDWVAAYAGSCCQIDSSREGKHFNMLT